MYLHSPVSHINPSILLPNLPCTLLPNQYHNLKSISPTNFYFGYQCYISALIFLLSMAWILLGSFIYCPIRSSSNECILWAPQYEFLYLYPLPKWTAPFFPPRNVTKISPLFVFITVALENLMTRTNEREHSLLASLGFLCDVTSSWLVDVLWKVYFL